MSNALLKRRELNVNITERQRKAVEIFQDKRGSRAMKIKCYN